MDFYYDWNEAKAIANYRKHGVSFEEAQTVFLDELSGTVYDASHSQDEDRYIDIGQSAIGRILVVVYTYQDNVVWIISSRQATPAERRTYEQGIHRN